MAHAKTDSYRVKMQKKCCSPAEKRKAPSELIERGFSASPSPKGLASLIPLGMPDMKMQKWSAAAAHF
jgi:hypothetical protein